MIRVITQPHGPPEVEINLERQPSVYLDQDSLSELATPGERRTRFLRTFEQKGTLLFSSANSFDLAGPQGGTSVLVEGFLWRQALQEREIRKHVVADRGPRVFGDLRLKPVGIQPRQFVRLSQEIDEGHEVVARYSDRLNWLLRVGH